MKEAFKENWRPGRSILSLLGALILVSALFIYQFTATTEPETNCIKPGHALIDSTLGMQSRDIFFDYESDAIREDAKPVLAENAEILKLNPDMFIIIQGEWDINETHGKLLAESRAQRVRDFIVSQGVESGRILTSSKCNQHGQRVSNTVEYKELNRRAHFISIELGQQGFALLDDLLTII
ncbi:MAG: OmpA family protein [Deltaproteobacteria bacterium]|nr:OmpA family protein [Deltaproteobacteria bacterium]